MGEPVMNTGAREITVEHLTTSLARVEDWCRAVRVALHSIPDKESIRFPGIEVGEPFEAKQPLRAGVCPPPEPDPDPTPGSDPPAKPEDRATAGA